MKRAKNPSENEKPVRSERNKFSHFETAQSADRNKCLAGHPEAPHYEAACCTRTHRKKLPRYSKYCEQLGTSKTRRQCRQHTQLEANCNKVQLVFNLSSSVFATNRCSATAVEPTGLHVMSQRKTRDERTTARQGQLCCVINELLCYIATTTTITTSYYQKKHSLASERRCSAPSLLRAQSPSLQGVLVLGSTLGDQIT